VFHCRQQTHQSLLNYKGISPPESVAELAIAFVVGVLSTLGFGKHIEKVQTDAQQGK
jgi:hypothetical protein